MTVWMWIALVPVLVVAGFVGVCIGHGLSKLFWGRP